MTREERPFRKPPASARGVGYRGDIEGLRAVAVLLVVLFHFGLPEALRAGFIGVDIFFVISGYLIVPPIIERLQAGQFSFVDFYERRVRRLAPALLATTLLTLVAGLIVLTPLEFSRFVREAIAAQLYVSNIYYWRYLNYFGLLAQQAFLLHTWSLGVEEQFYLTTPLLLWLASQFVPTRLAQLVLFVGLCSFGLNMMAVSWKPEAAFYLLPTRAWEFAVGALVPQLTALAKRRQIPTPPFIVFGIGLLACALALYEPTIRFPGWFALLPVVGTVFLLVGGSDRSTFYYRAMASAVPSYVGRISYELYLVHWPIKTFLPLLVLEVSLWDRIGALCLSLLLAAMIYHLVEAPIRSRQVLGRGKSLFLAYAAATFGVVLLLVFGSFTGGFPQRFSSQTVAIASAENDFDASFRDCEGRAVMPCRIGARDVHPTWLVYGDSHADALAKPFSQYLASRRNSAYFSFLSACLPVFEVGDDNCRRFTHDVADFITAHPEIQNVALVSTWQLGDGLLDDKRRFVMGPAAVSAFGRSLERTLGTYTKRRIIVWLPVPGARAPVPTTLARNAIWRRNWDLRVTRADYDRRTAFLTDILKRHDSVTLIRPADRLCRTGVCQVTDSGRPLYYDNAHPAASQASLFGSFIKEDLANLP